MIRIQNGFMEICQECPDLELDVNGEVMFSTPVSTEYVIRVQCKNKRLCSNAEKRVRWAMEHEEQKEDAE